MMPLQHVDLENIAAGRSGLRMMKRHNVAVAVELQQ
jgi:hypothetical protein